MIKGMGGAMDLASCCKKIIAVSNHSDKFGNSKFVKNCELPVTGQGCVKLLITNKGVWEWHDGKCYLKEVADDTTVEEVIATTDAEFEVRDNVESMEANSSTYVGEDDEDIFA